MSETETQADSEKQGDAVNAARELLLLGKKIVKARALLVSLESDLVDVRGELADGRQAEDLMQANQQLVLAMLGAQSDCAVPAAGEWPDQCQDTLEANEQLVLVAFNAQELQSKAEQALAQQKNILAQVAHELRNPLTPISMLAERMVSVPITELPRMRALIDGQVQQLSRIVEDLLDVSRVSGGKLRLNRIDLDIIQIIGAAIEACSPMMVARSLEFRASFSCETLIMSGDSVRLAQVLHNLLSNAVKYTPRGGHIHLSVRVENEEVTIVVADDGIGISAATLPFIFDPYVRDANAVMSGSGLGIGLTVVRELVEAHGGQIAALSAGEGQGSEFTVTLPLAHA